MKKLLFLLLFSISQSVFANNADRMEEYMNPLLQTQAKDTLLQQFGLPQNIQTVGGTEVWEYYKNNGVVNINFGNSYQAGVFTNGASYGGQIQRYEHLLCAFDVDGNLAWWNYDYR